jgi:hypothetical protein
MFQYRVAEMDYIFRQDPDERDLRKSKMQSGLAESENALEKLGVLLVAPEEKKAYEAVKADLAKCKAETALVLGMVAQKKDLEAQAEETGTANGNFEDLMSDIKAAIDLEVSAAAAASKNSTTLYQRTRWLVMGTLVVALAGIVHGGHQFADDRPAHSRSERSGQANRFGRPDRKALDHPQRRRNRAACRQHQHHAETSAGHHLRGNAKCRAHRHGQPEVFER